MITIRIYSSGSSTTLSEEAPARISDLIKKYGINTAFPCGGLGTCGKCKVRVEGVAEECTDRELSFLSDEERAGGIRLACMCRLTGDADVYVEAPRIEQILSWSDGSAISTVSTPRNKTTAGESERVGIACDVGSTTVVMRLYDLKTGALLAVEAEPNGQRAYGADVISRVTACAEHGVETLSAVIGEQLERMAKQCMAKAPDALLKRTVLTGNTVMLHIFEGLNPGSLALSPFTMQSSFGCVSVRTIGDAPVYIPQCIGAYTGADLLCAILASGMAVPDEKGYILLADIGTNGEMALAKPDGTILCCSAPAGPAFEGAGISMGMNAADGAVSAVRLNPARTASPETVCADPAHSGAVQQGDIGPDDERWDNMRSDAFKRSGIQIEVIGGGEAKGICGSGLIDCIAAMLELGVLDDTGYLEEDFILPGSSVKINQMDVRQVQLAKAAICGGVRTLLSKAGIGAEEVERFYIAGGFGSYMNLEAAAVIGLIPPELQKAARFIGNAALAGAAQQLLNKEAEERAAHIAQRSSELHLAADPYFTEVYIDCMSF